MTKDLSRVEPLLEDVIVNGEIVYPEHSLDEIRAQRMDDMNKLYPGVKRIMNPHHYHVSLTEELWDLKQELINEFSDGELG